MFLLSFLFFFFYNIFVKYFMKICVWIILINNGRINKFDLLFFIISVIISINHLFKYIQESLWHWILNNKTDQLFLILVSWPSSTKHRYHHQISILIWKIMRCFCKNIGDIWIFYCKTKLIFFYSLFGLINQIFFSWISLKRFRYCKLVL